MPRELDGTDPTTGVREALRLVDGRVGFPGGLDGVSEWMHSVSAIVDQISGDELRRTREEIREIIDQLLELNAHVQNLVRLKQLLS